MLFVAYTSWHGCRYHSANTLKTMAAFRIGRKPPGPWVNMTPPIRGGVYRKQGASPAGLFDVKEGNSDDESLAPSVASDSSVVTTVTIPDSDSCEIDTIDDGGPCGLSPEGVRKRIRVSGASEDSDEALFAARLSPEGYTNWAVQREIDQDLDL